MMMSDRIAVMHQGRIWQVGSPREVYERPCNLFVARFLGVSNELPGTIGSSIGEDRIFQPADGEQPPFPVRTVSTELADRSATLSLRPEHIRMVRERPSISDPVLSGRVEKVLFAGSDTKYLVRVGRDRVWETRMASGASHAPFTAGDPVFLHWSLADARVFVE